MDVRDLKYPSETFDLAIDKSTIDALLCGDHSFLNVAIMTKEIQRILKVGGIYLIISYGQPDNRVMHLVSLNYYFYSFIIGKRAFIIRYKYLYYQKGYIY